LAPRHRHRQKNQHRDTRELVIVKTRKIFLLVTSDMSAAAFYRGYLAYLRGHGWDVTLVGHSTGDLERIATSEGVRSIAVPMRRDPAPLHDLVSLARVVWLFAKSRPAAVVSATPKASLLGMVAARLSGVPVRVYQMWGLRLETETGVKRAIYRTLEKVTAFGATHIIANSRSLADAAEAEGIARDILVLGDGSATGIDLAHYSPDADMPSVDAGTAAFLTEGRAPFTVGFVGRVNRDKGVPALLAAAQLATGRGVPVQLLIVGSSESDEIERLIEQAAVELPVHRVLAVDDPRPYFLAMDVNCLPTLREGFPNVVLEAASLGVPTITTDATGARDSVVDDSTGLIFPVNDAEALAASIVRTATEPGLIERFSTAGRERVRTDFDQQIVWKAHEQFLRSAVAARARSAR
jgi:glycosyltransferase involved in cell wall biosynthesis